MSAIIFVVFILVFIFLMFGLFSLAEGRGRSKTPQPRRRISRQAYSPPSHDEERSTLVARQAMRRAGYNVADEYVRVTDIGLLEHRGSDRPRLLRFEKARTDSDYLRPFVELWLPYRSRGMVRFELLDRAGQLHYADEDEYDLKPGINALLPGTWLPLQGKIDSPEQWQLRVMVGDTVLSDHVFGWRLPTGGGKLQRHIASDGEISPALQQALDAQPREAVSLDDLLGD